MSQQKPKQVEKTKLVRDELLPFEFMALSCLMKHWAYSSLSKEKANFLSNKISYIREAVISGFSRGSRHTIPPELVLDEYDVAKKTYDYWNNKYSEGLPTYVVYEIRDTKNGEVKTFKRPIPVSENVMIEIWPEISSWKSKKKIISRRIVSERFGISERTIRNNLKKRNKVLPKTRHKTFCISFEQKLLACVYIDLCMETELNYLSIQAEILDSLFVSNYPIIMLYYLTQIPHFLTRNTNRTKPTKIFTGRYEENEVQKLCQSVRASRVTLEGNSFADLFPKHDPALR
jgi:hypothetical protein